MKILVLADVESKYLWDYFSKDKLEGIDLIISCGDLKASYLSFLATFTHAPVLYVHGNHDAAYDTDPPDGCICIDDKIYNFEGIRIIGFGGSMRYKPGPYQYTEAQMKKRILSTWLKRRSKGGIDIVVAHSAIYGIGDGDDLAHTGFQCFKKLIEQEKPKYFIHGHLHASYGGKFKRETVLEDTGTTVINAYERYIIEFENK